MPTRDTEGRTVVDVFAGYQFRSRLYKRSGLEEAITRACAIAQDDMNLDTRVSIRFTPPEVDVGNYLRTALGARIEQADLCIFEVSEINPNVYYELGVADALRKPVVLLCSGAVDVHSAIASDLSGTVLLKYDDTDHLGTKLAAEIDRHVSQLISADSSLERQLRKLWMEGSSGETILVGEDIALVREGDGRKDVRYVHSGDVFALTEARICLMYVNPTQNVVKASSRDFAGADFGKNLIAIGGPRSNSVTQHLLKKLKLPWVFNLDPACNEDGKEIVNSTTGEVRRATRDSNLSEDICMIVAGPNPFSRSKRILIFAGLHTFGVLGGLRSILPTAAWSDIRHNVQAFADNGWSPDRMLQVVAPVPVYNLDAAAATLTGTEAAIEVL